MFRAEGSRRDTGLMFGWQSIEVKERILEKLAELCSNYIHSGHSDLLIQTPEILIGGQS